MNRLTLRAMLGFCAALSAGAMPARGAPGPTPPGPTPPVCYPSLITPSSGMLDQFFGCRGITTTAAPGSTPTAPILYVANDLAIQPDDAIVVVGSRRDNNRNAGDTLVARYTPGGTLDATFGAGGIRIVDVSSTAFGAEVASAVMLQPDQKIVVVGGVTNETSGGTRGYILRLLPNGNLDTTFGAGGLGFTLLDGIEDATDLAPDGSGGFYVAGKRCVVTGCSARLARIASDGSLVASFGTKGTLTFSYPGSTSQSATAVRAASGRLTVVGAANMVTTTTGNLGVMRFTLGAGGVVSPDPAFGTSGGLTRALGSAGRVSDVLIASAGAMLVGAAGTVGGVTGPNRFLLFSISADGRVATPLAASFPGTTEGELDALVPSGARTYAAGSARNSAGQWQMAVAAYAYGALDPAFSGDGMTVPFVGGSVKGTAIGVQSTGRIVVAGTTQDLERRIVLLGIVP